MKEFLEYIITLDFPTIVGMFIIGWYFTREIREDVRSIKVEMKQLERDTKQSLSEQSARADKLYQMFNDTLKEIKDMHGRVSVLEERNRK